MHLKFKQFHSVILAKNIFYMFLCLRKELYMKISDLKYLFPRMKYSKHTPKRVGYSENYFMNHTSINDLKQPVLEKSPKEDNYAGKTIHNAFDDTVIGHHHVGQGGKLFM